MRLLYAHMAHLTFSYGNDEAEFLEKVKIADNLSKAGWSWGCVSAIDVNGRTIWIADAHRGDGKRFVVRADKKLTAFGSPLVARSSNLLMSKEGVRIPS
jgi:hypothetical protein